ncbi:hypothetical protein J6590_084557 [Homalodisca vitripennis]|nr:hypothetical protein J6590_084557 [Homalodisca vitripennis]
MGFWGAVTGVSVSTLGDFSTCTALPNLVNYMPSAKDRGLQTLVTELDFSQAFDANDGLLPNSDKFSVLIVENSFFKDHRDSAVLTVVSMAKYLRRKLFLYMRRVSDVLESMVIYNYQGQVQRQ